MPITVECSSCRNRFGAPDHLAGKSVRCPSCTTTIKIPGEAAAPAPAPARPSPAAAAPAKAAPKRPAQPMAGGWGPQAPAAAPSSTPWALIIGLAVGVGGLLLLAIVGVVLFVVFAGGSDEPEVAQVDPNNAATFDPASSNSGPSNSNSVSTSPGDSNSSSTPAGNSGSGSNSGGFGSLYGNDSGAPAGNSTTRPSVAGGFGTPAPGIETPGGDEEQETRPNRNTSSGRNSTASSSGTRNSTGQVSIVTGLDKWWNRSEKNEGSVDVEDMELAIYHYSWLTELLPYIGRNDLYDKLDMDQTFNRSVSNIQVAQALIPQYLNPADDRTRFEGHYFEGLGLTHFVGMSGVENTRNTTAALLPRTDDRAGIFGYDEIAKTSDVTDGLGNTIMMIGGGLAAGPWISGGGHSVRGARMPHFDAFTGFGSKGVDDGGAIVVMADGSVRVVTADIADEAFRAMCTIHGKETVDVEASTKPSNDWSTRRNRAAEQELEVEEEE